MVGYGIEGRALAQYFCAKGDHVTVCDVREQKRNDEPPAGTTFRCGSNYLDQLESFDQIFRSPGIPYLKHEFDAVREKLTSLTRYFFEHCPCPIIGVTGTKGKGTTTMLIYEMLRAWMQKGRVFIGGNIGAPPLDFLDELTKNDLVVLELSSFQLQDLNQSPHVAVVLGITPDHLDHHHSLKEYGEAKRRMVQFQKENDIAVLDIDNPTVKTFEKHTPAKIYHVSTEGPVARGGFKKLASLMLKDSKTGTFLGEKHELGLIGEHNIKNILAASAAAHALGVPVEVISRVIREFKGLPHRLELVGELSGARFYNDSASTNPETAIAAVRTFSTPTILILGGSDKSTDFTPLGREIAKKLNIRTVILMGETKSKIETSIEEAVKETAQSARRDVPLELISADTFQEAFMVARLMAQPGDTVLLSPACASFDMFRNYQERGDIFRNFITSSL